MLVYDFGVKNPGKDHLLHLKAEQEDKCTVNIRWEGKLYIGIALKWEYEKGTVRLSMPGYVRPALHSFKYKKHEIPQDSPYPWTQPIYGEKKSHAFRKGTI